ncbi:MAG: hypothetical protein EOO68_18245 [Moraxellaceae bacterium]|nr:MAG: hypothetical protein EOO68_18245 [Moraxellaceae bacterium]
MNISISCYLGWLLLISVFAALKNGRKSSLAIHALGNFLVSGVALLMCIVTLIIAIGFSAPPLVIVGSAIFLVRAVLKDPQVS